jgi:hypothetical protein
MHTNRYLEDVQTNLLESLRRLGVDMFRKKTIYLFDGDVTIGEMVDALHEDLDIRPASEYRDAVVNRKTMIGNRYELPFTLSADQLMFVAPGRLAPFVYTEVRKKDNDADPPHTDTRKETVFVTIQNQTKFLKVGERT